MINYAVSNRKYLLPLNTFTTFSAKRFIPWKRLCIYHHFSLPPWLCFGVKYMKRTCCSSLRLCMNSLTQHSSSAHYVSFHTLLCSMKVLRARRMMSSSRDVPHTDAAQVRFDGARLLTWYRLICGVLVRAPKCCWTLLWRAFNNSMLDIVEQINALSQMFWLTRPVKKNACSISRLELYSISAELITLKRWLDNLLLIVCDLTGMHCRGQTTLFI